jgi:hypothetical protein
MTFDEPFIHQNSQCINAMYLNIILNKTLAIVTPNMHKVRQIALSVCVNRFDGM